MSNTTHSGTVTDEIIQAVCSLSGANISDVRKELQVLEAKFYKWAKESIKEDIQQVKYSGVTIHSEDAARALGAVLLQGKIEGFLMAVMSQDRAWNDKLFIDHSVSQEGVPYAEAVAAMMEGRLDEEVYVKMKKEMTPAEKKDKSCWKHKALNAYKKNNERTDTSKTVREYMKDQQAAEEKRRKDSPGGDEAPEVPLTP